MSSPEKKTRPFFCGTQVADWKCRNCYECAKGYADDAAKWNCDLELALDESFMCDGTLSDEHAKRMGACGKYNWDCPERTEKQI